jgi:hypothetical protein
MTSRAGTTTRFEFTGWNIREKRQLRRLLNIMYIIGTLIWRELK